MDERARGFGSRCTVCDRTGGQPIFTEMGFSALQCPCGAAYISPRPIPGSLNETLDLHKPEYYSLPARRRARWLGEHLAAGELVEVGAGDGHFLLAVREEGFRVAGIEPNDDRVRHARAQDLSVEHATLASSTRQAGSCDVVYHCDLLSHFDDPIGSLVKMRTFIRSHGALCFEVGLVSNLKPGWYENLGTLGMPAHLWFYDFASLEALLAQAGLRIEKAKCFGLGPLIALSLLGRLTRLGGAATERREISAPTGRVRDGLWKARFRTWMRYGLGALTPRWGPQTVWVIARSVV